MSNALKYKAVYKDGVLIPYNKIDLDQGEKVEIEIKREENKKNISLRGLWKRSVIKDEDIDEAKFIWENGLKKQIKILNAK
ncbi:MAG: antitoxin family protein [Candidatus Kuenenia sp.]|nr:antitoxin family protein [Candidatus Kuenenia sp.]MCR4313162.1 antitoxin family protein [Candidatus Roizmanbacteria bacterium]